MNHGWAGRRIFFERGVATILVLVLLNGLAAYAAGYKGIRVGQNVSELPKNFALDMAYSEGQYEGSWFRISILNGKVLSFEVIYSGKSLNKAMISNPISLGEAVKFHSLQPNLVAPMFGYATDRKGTRYGLADFANQIVYAVDSIEASASVTTVTYVSATAPVIATAKRLPVDSFLVDDLLYKARLVASEKNIALPGAENKWSYTTEHDELHGTKTESFDLNGDYIVEPRNRIGDIHPFLSVYCKEGRFYAGGIAVGALADSEMGWRVDYNIDGVIGTERGAGITDDFESVWFQSPFADEFFRRLVNAKEVILGVWEYQGGQVQVHFSMPSSSEITHYCNNLSNR
jgi:hypothetical protein